MPSPHLFSFQHAALCLRDVIPRLDAPTFSRKVAPVLTKMLADKDADVQAFAKQTNDEALALHA
jgi:hypothetical protein